MTEITRVLPPEGRHRKRSVYVVLLWFAVVATAASFGTRVLEGETDPASSLVGGVALTLFLVIVAAARLRRVRLEWIEHALLWSVTGILLLNLVARLYLVALDAFGVQAVVTTLLWFPLVFVFSTVAFDGERSLRYSAAAYVLFVLVTLPYAFGSMGGDSTVGGFGLLLQAYLAYAVTIAALYFFADLQQRMVAMEETARTMRKLANTDALTGLANRRQGEEQLARELRRAERYGRVFSVLMLDIDHFKDLNDRFGHQAGDEVLVDLSRRIGSMVRASDTVARWGGEEFLLLTPETPVGDAQRLAEMVRRHVAENSLAGRYQVTVSLGVASYRPGDTLASLIARSDAALYLAKRGGRNQVRLEIVPAPHAD
jgi:diguanylate cyclase (GGDEF)-like protein